MIVLINYPAVRQAIVTDAELMTSIAYTTADNELSGEYTGQAQFAFSPDLLSMSAFDKSHDEPRGFLAMRSVAQSVSMDLGLSAELRNSIIISFAATDLGDLQWKGRAKETEFTGQISFNGDRDDIDKELIDSLASTIEFDITRESGFTTPQPSALRLGVSAQMDKLFHKLPGEMLLGIDMNIGMNNEPSNSTIPRYSIGMDYLPGKKWPVFLAGMTFDQEINARLGLGLGYRNHFVDVYASTIDLISMIQNDDRISFSLVARWKFMTGFKNHNENSGF